MKFPEGTVLGPAEDELQSGGGDLSVKNWDARRKRSAWIPSSQHATKQKWSPYLQKEKKKGEKI